jgi:hypothetical protein
MKQKIVFLSSMTIAAVPLFCTSGHIGNQQAIAFGGFGYYYSSDYVIDNPCDGGPYSMIDGQVV